MTVENSNAVEEEIEVQIVEDPPEGQEGGAVSNDDELERYTKSVSKRINKLNQKTKQAEERAQYLESLALQKDQELDAYKKHLLLSRRLYCKKSKKLFPRKKAR